MSVHDRVVEYRRGLVAAIESSGNKRTACQQVGIHHSTFYRWRRDAGPQHKARSWVDQRTERLIVSEALSDPSAGPLRVADRLEDRGIVVSGSKVWRTLVKHNLNTRAKRYGLLAQHRTPPVFELAQTREPPMRHLKADIPGDLVQMDCLHVGSFKETRLGKDKASKGQIWQYTAIDVASSYTWAELHATSYNPDPVNTSSLAHRVADDLTTWGWNFKTVTTDNGNEYKASLFRDTIEGLNVEHRFIRAGRPQSNGKVERVQGTMIEEFYQPTLINYVQPSITGLRLDLDHYLTYYNHTRRHRGRWNKGTTPASIMITPNRKLTP